MRILVTFAVNAEFAPWRRLREFAGKDDGPCKIRTARFGQNEIGVLLTGIGGKSGWLGTTKRIWDGEVDICISSGLAGALREEYSPSDILVPRTVWAVARKKTIPCDSELLRAAVENGAREVGSFYSAEKVVTSAVEKRDLGRTADAVEMESGEVLYEAAELGARVIAIRGISDAAGENLPLDFNRVTSASGEVSLTRVLRQVARKPAAVPALIRFGQQSRMAAEKLCGFLDRYVQCLVQPKPGLEKEAAR